MSITDLYVFGLELDLNGILGIHQLAHLVICLLNAKLGMKHSDLHFEYENFAKEFDVL